MNVVWVALGVALLALLVVTLSYNRFVHQRQLIRNAWADVDTELRRRYDLIPNLVQTVKGYAAHERAVLEEVVRARTAAVASSGPTEQQAADENALVGALQHLFAVAEAYPDLEANQGFLELQRELVITEDRIQSARRLFNANVRDYNRRVQSVPSNLVARLFGFRADAFFEVDRAIREGGPPQVRVEATGP
ncbi:MAG: LemA family protein [Acidimicrobiales bacterium]|nr:LemA family protein [Acidimicrobiales bacterium]